MPELQQHMKGMAKMSYGGLPEVHTEAPPGGGGQAPRRGGGLVQESAYASLESGPVPGPGVPTWWSAVSLLRCPVLGSMYRQASDT